MTMVLMMVIVIGYIKKNGEEDCFEKFRLLKLQGNEKEKRFKGE